MSTMAELAADSLEKQQELHSEQVTPEDMESPTQLDELYRLATATPPCVMSQEQEEKLCWIQHEHDQKPDPDELPHKVTKKECAEYDSLVSMWNQAQ